MAVSLSGAVLTGINSSFHSGGAKLSSVGAVRFGRKTELVVVAQRKKTLVYAVQGEGNVLDDLKDATKKATDFVSEKANEALKEGEKAKDFVVEKAGEAKDTVEEESKKASEVVSEKGKEAAEFVEDKSGEAKEAIKS